jgi:hypothetical protein
MAKRLAATSASTTSIIAASRYNLIVTATTSDFPSKALALVNIMRDQRPADICVPSVAFDVTVDPDKLVHASLPRLRR